MHRDLNVATSRSVFAGPYFESSEEKERFGKAFLDMTEGFLALPICIPGTAVWRAKKGRLYILDLLEKAAARSKTAMKVSCSLVPILSGCCGCAVSMDTQWVSWLSMLKAVSTYTALRLQLTFMPVCMLSSVYPPTDYPLTVHNHCPHSVLTHPVPSLPTATKIRHSVYAYLSVFLLRPWQLSAGMAFAMCCQ